MPSHHMHQLTPASSNMRAPFDVSVILAAVTIALSLTQHANAAPASNTLGAPIGIFTSAVQVVELNETPALDDIQVDICSQFYLEPPCTRVVLVPGSCAVVPSNLFFSSMSYGPKVTCRLYTGLLCGAQGTPAGEMINVPYEVTSDLSRVGWNKKANSFDCQGPSDPVGTLLPGHPPRQALSVRDATPRTVAFAHHRSRDMLHITVYDKVQFDDDNSPGSGYEFVMSPNLCIKLRDVDFERKTSSIKFERGPVCTFFENGDCNGGPALVLAIEEPNLQPFHTDDWKTWNDRISSFSCQLKNALKTRESAPNEVSVAHSPADEWIKVSVWTDVGFSGDVEDWSLQPGVCASLMGTLQENAMSSMDFERGQTCTFYETPDCNKIVGTENAPTLVLKFGETNLEAFHTDDWKTWNDRIGSFTCVWNN